MLLNARNIKLIYPLVAAFYYSLVFFDIDTGPRGQKIFLFGYDFLFFFIILQYLWNVCSKNFSSLYLIDDYTNEETVREKFAGIELSLLPTSDEKESTIERLKQQKNTLGFIIGAMFIYTSHSMMKTYIFNLDLIPTFKQIVSSIFLVLVFSTFRFWGAHLLGLFLGLIIYAISMSGDTLQHYIIHVTFIGLFFALLIFLTSWYWQSIALENFSITLKAFFNRMLPQFILFLSLFYFSDWLIPKKNNFSNIFNNIIEKSISRADYLSNKKEMSFLEKIPKMTVPEQIPPNGSKTKMHENIEKLAPFNNEIVEIKNQLEINNEILKQAKNSNFSKSKEIQELLEKQNLLKHKLNTLRQETKLIETIIQKSVPLNEQKSQEFITEKTEFIKAIDKSIKTQELDNLKLTQLTSPESILEMLNIQKHNIDLDNLKTELGISPSEIDKLSKTIDINGEINKNLIPIYKEMLTDEKLIENYLINNEQNSETLKKEYESFLRKSRALSNEAIKVLNKTDPTTFSQQIEKHRNNIMIKDKTIKELRDLKENIEIKDLIRADLRLKEAQNQQDKKIIFEKELGATSLNDEKMNKLLSKVTSLQSEIDQTNKDLYNMESLGQKEALDVKHVLMKQKALELELKQKKRDYAQQQRDQLKSLTLAKMALKNKNDQLAQKYNLIQDLNQSITNKNTTGIKAALDKIKSQESKKNFKLTKQEQAEIKTIEEQLKGPEVKKKSKDFDFTSILSKVEPLLHILFVFILFYFMQKITSKKKSIPIEIYDPELKMKLKSNLKELPTKFQNFTQEVLTHYRFYHQTINDIYFNDHFAPPPMILPQYFCENNELAMQAETLGSIFNKIQYEKVNDFSASERNAFRKSFKGFIKVLKL